MPDVRGDDTIISRGWVRATFRSEPPDWANWLKVGLGLPPSRAEPPLTSSDSSPGSWPRYRHRRKNGSVNATTVGEGIKAAITFFTAGIGATIVLLIPGYLLSSAYDRNRQGSAPTERAFIAGSAVGAIFVHLLMLFWTARLISGIVRDGPARHVLEIGAWAVVVLVIVPTVLGAVLALLAEVRSPSWLRMVFGRLGLSSAVRVSQAWDWVFSRGFPAYVRVQLSDGRTVYGLYSADSFASSDNGSRDLYLEEQWTEERGWFAGPHPQSRGVWLSGGSIVSIEFFDGRPAVPEDDKSV